MKIRSYHEMAQFATLEERFSYLALKGAVGAATFGFDRYINQRFYRSSEWRHIRHHVIARDRGMDLGVEGYEIFDRVLIHHMNPISLKDLEEGNDDIVDPEFLISTTHQTHNAIHYGDADLLPKPFVPRRPGDTKLW